MSTYAGQLESASTVPAESVLERRLTRYLIAIGGLLTGVGAFVLVAPATTWSIRSDTGCYSPM